MNESIQTTLIGGLCTITSSIIVLLLKNYFGTKKYQILGSQRKEVIKGVWKGKTFQDRGPDGEPIDVDLSINLTFSRKIVKGEGTVHWRNIDEIVELHGGFYTDSFILLNYNSKIKSKINFGVLILKLSSNGRMLEGKMIGYGSESEILISGITKFEKQ